MKQHFFKYIRNTAITAGFIAVAMCICVIMHQANANAGNAHLIFVLAVLMISRFTEGYLWGVIASVTAVFAVNYMFTYPYFHFNLKITGYLLTFMVNLAVSLIVSVMNTRIKQQESIRITAERERLRADLFRSVSHDLRTPLTSIIGSTSAVLENDIPAEKQLELIADVNTEAQWLLRMVENLLAVTRVSQNAQPLRLQTEVVEEVIADSVIKFRKHFSDINVEKNAPDDILFADMEPVLIGQVLTNLLENAAYHGGDVDTITITLNHSGGYISIEVNDNGCGISPDLLSKIFTENEVSARRRGADARKGMGIGLSVCMSIVKAHGGTMSATNIPGSGASFIFKLPEKEIEYGTEGTDIDS